MTMMSPPHVGEMVGAILNDIELSVTKAAQNLNVSRQTLSELINERRGLSPEMALRLEAVFGGSAESWMRNQNAYDMAQIRKKEAEITKGLERISID